jgi:transposase
VPPEFLPDKIDALKAALVAERAARQQAEARASGAEAMVAHLKLLIAKMRRERFGPSAERSRLLDQLELQLEELEASATEDEAAVEAASADTPRCAASPASGRSAGHCRHICRASGW